MDGFLSSAYWYFGLVAAVGIERLVELVISRRHAAAALARGGVEYGTRHFRWMALLHTGFLIAAPVEVFLLRPPFHPGLGWSALTVVVAAQAIRYWAIATLGSRWNVRVIVVPGEPVVTTGPYRWLRHPNYLAVVLEGVALPMVHGAAWTAVVFTILNAWVLSVRIRCEEKALEDHNHYRRRLQGRARLFPGF